VTGLRERKKHQTREQLMYTSIRLITERGFDEVTVEELADAANVSPSTFFRYVDSKAGAVFGFASERLAGLQQMIDEKPANATVLDTVREFWLGVVPNVLADADAYRGQITLSDRYPAVAAERARVFDDARILVARALRREDAARPSHEVEMLAALSISAGFTAQRVWHDEGGDVGEIFEACWKIVARGAGFTS
jgi:AcrR family transcriptional regulator